MNPTLSYFSFGGRTVARLNARAERAPALSSLSFDEMTRYVRCSALDADESAELTLFTTAELSVASAHSAVQVILAGAFRGLATPREAELERRLAATQLEVQSLRHAVSQTARRLLSAERLGRIADEISRAVSEHPSVRRTWASVDERPDGASTMRALVRLRFEPTAETTVETVVEIIRLAHRAFASALPDDERDCVELDADSSEVPAQHVNKGADFLPVASHLGAPPPSLPAEASLRSSYGRSYYAAFSVAGAALEQAGFALSTGPDRHDQVSTLLRTSKSIDVSQCGSELMQLRRTRNVCDYDMSTPVTVTDAAKGYQLARQIIADIGKAQIADARLGIPKQESYQTDRSEAVDDPSAGLD